MSDKSKHSCADCGSNDTTWAVVNRGVLICDQCCNVHRSLSRHISIVKSLTKSNWRPSQLNMVHMLNNSSINSFWEHSLTDPKCNRKKPSPNDPVHPTKAEFIRAKYQDLAFVLKSRSSNNQEDLNQQLHSSVRTSNLETSLRLLTHGADPNYFYPEKGTHVVHVAAHAGQMEQFELLLCYGANLNVKDVHENTPQFCAKASGHPEMADMITECMYEVTDKFCHYLCSRVPNHRSGEHLIVPEITECSVTPSFSKQARLKLQLLQNFLFEELVMDVYDEVERREIEAVCCTSKSSVNEHTVPFLPVNPELSTMRNQGRQKLATLSKEEFTAFLWDILADARRRQQPLGNIANRLRAELSREDEPLYDSVASDEDYASIDQQVSKINEKGSNQDSNDHNEEDSYLKSRLISSELQITDLVSQLTELRHKVDILTEENSELRSKMKSYKKYDGVATQSEQEQQQEQEQSSEPKQRPISLYNIAQQYIGASSNSIERTTLPQTDEVLHRTDQVTKKLLELSAIMRSTEAKQNAFMPCAEQIRVAVADLSAIFPQVVTDETVRTALRTLNTSTIRLQAICSEMDTTIDKVRKCAFNMAKANRQILTRFQ